MADTSKRVTIDPKQARQGRERIIEEHGKLRDEDAPGSHDPSGTADAAPADDRRDEAKRKTGLGMGFVRRTD